MERYPFEKPYQSRPISKVPMQSPDVTVTVFETRPHVQLPSLRPSLRPPRPRSDMAMATWRTSTQWLSAPSTRNWIACMFLRGDEYQFWNRVIVEYHHRACRKSCTSLLHLVLLRAAWNALLAWTVRSVFITLRHSYSKPDLLQMYSNRKWHKTASRLSHISAPPKKKQGGSDSCLQDHTVSLMHCKPSCMLSFQLHRTRLPCFGIIQSEILRISALGQRN